MVYVHSNSVHSRISRTFVVRKVAVLSFEEEVPQTNIRDGNIRVCRLGWHGVGEVRSGRVWWMSRRGSVLNTYTVHVDPKP